jgi:hypothetical protein
MRARSLTLPQPTLLLGLALATALAAGCRSETPRRVDASVEDAGETATDGGVAGCVPGCVPAQQALDPLRFIAMQTDVLLRGLCVRGLGDGGIA